MTPLPPRSTLFPYTTLFRSKGKEGKLPETPKKSSRIFKRVHNVLVGTNEESCQAAAEVLEKRGRSEEHTSELQSRENLVCRLLLEKKKKRKHNKQTQRKNHE